MKLNIILITFCVLINQSLVGSMNVSVLDKCPSSIVNQLIDASFQPTNNLIADKVNINNQIVIWETTQHFSNNITNSLKGWLPSADTVINMFPSSAQSLASTGCTFVKPRILLVAGAGFVCTYVIMLNSCGFELPENFFSAQSLARLITTNSPVLAGLKSAGSSSLAKNIFKKPAKAITTPITNVFKKNELTWLTGAATLPITLIALQAISSQDILSVAAATEIGTQLYTDFPVVSSKIKKKAFWMVGMIIASGIMASSSFLQSPELTMQTVYDFLMVLFNLTQYSFVYATANAVGNWVLHN